jgi:hypothetical protein
MKTLTLGGRHYPITKEPEQPFDQKENKRLHAFNAVASFSAIFMLVLIPLQIAVFFNWPPPSTVTGWFTLFHRVPLVALVDMDILLAVDYLLTTLIFLALYFNLKNKRPAVATLALTSQLLAVCIYFSSTGAFEMLSLSKQYHEAGAWEEKMSTIAAGKAIMVNWQGTAFNFSYILGGIALLLISYAMASSRVFKKNISYIGYVTGCLMMLPPTIGMTGIIVSLLSLIPTIIWLILLGKNFYELERS